MYKCNTEQKFCGKDLYVYLLLLYEQKFKILHGGEQAIAHKELETAIKNSKNRKSEGLDGIPMDLGK
jgi:hypothetical protein